MKNFCYLTLVFLVFTSCAGMPTQHRREMDTQTECIEGLSRQGFLTQITTGDIPCASGVQTCIKNQWQGPTLYDSCENYTKSCNGTPNGASVTGFLLPTSPHGIPCTPAIKTCMNGQWSGPEVFPSCSEML